MSSSSVSPAEIVPRARRRRVWLRRALAWGVSGAVIAFLLTRYSPTEIAAALAQGNWKALIPIVCVASLWSMAFMAVADWLIFRALLGAVGPLEVLRGKAGCSVLQAVNHAVGQGAYAVWIGRQTKSDIATTVGAIGYIVASDLAVLFAIVTGAMWISGEPLPRGDALRWLAPLALLGILAVVFFGPRLLPRLLPRLGWLTAWRRIGPARFAVIIATRATAVGGVMLMTWIGARVFGLPIPLAAFLAYLPVIFLIAALPINVLGFGAVQLVWVAAFDGWVSGVDILAFQFLLQATLVATFVLRGVPFLPSVLRDIGPRVGAPTQSVGHAS